MADAKQSLLKHPVLASSSYREQSPSKPNFSRCFLWLQMRYNPFAPSNFDKVALVLVPMLAYNTLTGHTVDPIHNVPACPLSTLLALLPLQQRSMPRAD